MAPKRSLRPVGDGKPSKPKKATMKPGSIAKGGAMGAADGTKRMQARMAGGYAKLMGGKAAMAAGRKVVPPKVRTIAKPVGGKRKPGLPKKS